MAAHTHPVFELKYYAPGIDQSNPWIREHPFPSKTAHVHGADYVPYGPYWAHRIPKNEETYYGSCTGGSAGRVRNDCNPANGMRPVIEKSEETGTYHCVCKNLWGQYGCNNESFAHC